MNESIAALSNDECKKLFRQTRDFGLYLDLLNRLKNKYLIILCLKNTAGQNISEETVEKIRSLGFSAFTAEPDMKYAGIYNNGSTVHDSLSKADEQPLELELNVSKIKLFISFKGKETEIKINGEEQSLNGKGLNIVVYDLKKSKAADVCCYNASEGNPTFYHRNFYYDRQYIDTHIYMPESYMDKAVLPLKRSYFSDRSLNVREVEKGIFLPTKCVGEEDDEEIDIRHFKRAEKLNAFGGVCDESFNFIAGHQLFNPRGLDHDNRHIWCSYRVAPEKITYIDETVLYGGSLIEHPGHLIVECFADRLWWIVQNADSDIKIAIEKIWDIRGWSTGVASFVMEFLEAFGISEDRIIIVRRPTQFKSIIIPDQSSIPLNYCFPYDFTSEYIKPFEHIKKQLTPGEHKKIYLTKSKATRKSVIGEEYFIDFFRNKGFAIINPEDYSTKEKAELMYGAEEVVTLDGTNSLFSIFCKPSVRLTILTRRLDFWDTPQQLITEALGIKEFFLVNTSGNFLENISDETNNMALVNYSDGLTLAYATKEFARYVKYIYNEELDITPEESLKKCFFDYLAFFPKYYSQGKQFIAVSSVRITDILRSMSEIFLGEKLDTSGLHFVTDDERTIKRLKLQLQKERDESAEEIKALSEKAAGLTEANAYLNSALAQRDAEIQKLRKDNAELSAYMAEINQLLDALESQNDPPSEQ